MNHTAKTLAKYLGKDVWFIGDIDFPEMVVVLESVRNRCNEVTLGLGDEGSEDEISADPNHVYPILKTVENLTEEEVKELWGGTTRFEIEEINLFNPYQFRWLIDNQTGAIPPMPNHRKGIDPNKKSPTGYISIHDNLPCIRWREDGVYSL